jgi:N-acetylglucosaminyl-diphospho-decaprenol L-rhamnosyltransferase
VSRLSRAVVVVSHDTRDEALGCLATLPAAGADEVVLVDTGSRDGTAAAVRSAHPEVRVLELDNLGFGRGANAGARASTADVLVVCNADVRFEAGSIELLARRLADDPSVAAAGPAVRYPDGRHQASARDVPDLATAVGHALLSRLWRDNPWTRRYRRADADPARARDADWLSGCALALRRTAFEGVGGFDPAYFLYVEDLDLGVRLRRAGWRLRYEPDARVVHRVGASTGRRRVWALTTHARSLDRYYARHVGRGAVGRLARPLVRVALAGWVLATLLWERLVGRGRSTTGE